MTATDIEMALTQPGAVFDRRRFLCVPNVSYGLGLSHECDLLAMTPAQYLHEIEIKMTVSDLRRDRKKGHQHRSGLIKYFWFAAPARLTLALLDEAPAGAGIIAVTDARTHRRCDIVWPAAARPAHPLTPDDRYRLARLGCIRYWDEKDHTQRLLREMGVRQKA